MPGLGAALYEPARSNHAHFVCAGCGRIEDIDCEIPSRDIQGAVAARGGVVSDIALTVNGRCAACRAQFDAAES